MVAPYAGPSPTPPTPGGDPTKVMWRRVLAAVIDLLIVAVPFFALASSSLEYLPEERLQTSGEAFCDEFLERFDGACVDFTDVDDRVYFTNDVSAGPVLWLLLSSIGIHVVLQGLTGLTPGKLVAGVRCVREDGSPPGLGRALGRWVLMVVDGQPCGIPLVGLITAGTSTGHRRVGDMAVKTFVVHKGAAGSPVHVPGLTGPLGPGGYGDAPWGAGGWQAPPPGSWGAPAQPGPPGLGGGWSQPEPAPPAAPAAQGPQWDEARGTYIQWDPAQSKWLQWDEAAKRWDVIPGQ
mgnify:CR=1 FL=1